MTNRNSAVTNADRQIARLTDLSIDLDLAIGVRNGVILVAPDTYKILLDHQLIDFEPSNDDSRMRPVFYGRRIIVLPWWEKVGKSAAQKTEAAVTIRAANGCTATIQNLDDVDASKILTTLADVNVGMDLSDSRGPSQIIVTVAAYKQLIHNNLIDYLTREQIEADSSSQEFVPTFLGRRVIVPGTVFHK